MSIKDTISRMFKQPYYPSSVSDWCLVLPEAYGNIIVRTLHTIAKMSADIAMFNELLSALDRDEHMYIIVHDNGFYFAATQEDLLKKLDYSNMLVIDIIHNRASLTYSQPSLYEKVAKYLLPFNNASKVVPSVGALLYTKDKPKQEGFYFAERVGYLSGKVFVTVVRAYAIYKGGSVDTLFADGENNSIHDDSFLRFAGPIPEPARD